MSSLKKHTLQNIVYSEYLPVVLGRSTMDLLGIDLDAGSTYNEVYYHDSSPIIQQISLNHQDLDPSIMNEFATAAMRFGHSTVSGLFKPVGHQKWPLKFHYFDFQKFVLGR